MEKHKEENKINANLTPADDPTMSAILWSQEAFYDDDS